MSRVDGPVPRPARQEDVPAMARIARAAYAPYVAEIGFEPPPMVQDFPAAIGAGRAWVIGQPVQGFVVAYATGDDWHIENVAVAPEAQGRGLGRALIAFAEAEGRARGHRRAVLYTNAAMRPNLTLYPRLGYARTGRRLEDGLDRVYFAKRLEPEP